ncbi:hypothetical protein CVT25_001508 [Psilocybe cyanescens]|uniref:Uncharacterized protein n=1 Tax=Psilocybe cyanescens TaxID=93625 RepID=A0A409WNJ5_PSICY|nr:hypothetical protein CVT25_001508 [Psilocybe cyanescens]
MDALILIFGAVHGLREVYLPASCLGILSKDDQKDITLALTRTSEDGTSAHPAIIYEPQKRQINKTMDTDVLLTRKRF